MLILSSLLFAFLAQTAQGARTPDIELLGASGAAGEGGHADGAGPAAAARVVGRVAVRQLAAEAVDPEPAATVGFRRRQPGYRNAGTSAASVVGSVVGLPSHLREAQ